MQSQKKGIKNQKNDLSFWDKRILTGTVKSSLWLREYS